MSDPQPTLPEVIYDAIESRLVDLHTCMPGYVEKFDAAKQICNVQPALMRKFANGKVEPLPVVTNVPVLYPRGSKFSVTFPLDVGDSVLLFFSERSIDRWMSKGGVVDPADARKHHLSDAFCMPGGYPSTKSLAGVSSTHVRLEFDKARFEIQKDGKFKIENTSENEELMKILSEFIQEVSIAQTAVGPLLNASLLAAFKVRLDKLKGA